MGGSGVAYVLVAKFLHPRPKAMGVEFITVELVSSLVPNGSHSISNSMSFIRLAFFQMLRMHVQGDRLPRSLG